MARFRENLGMKSEVMGGRVPLSEMDSWMEVLHKQPGGFTDKEKQEFFEAHLAVKVAECMDNGMSQETTVKEVVKELSSGSNMPNSEIIDFVQKVVGAIFKEVNN